MKIIKKLIIRLTVDYKALLKVKKSETQNLKIFLNKIIPLPIHNKINIKIITYTKKLKASET